MEFQKLEFIYKNLKIIKIKNFKMRPAHLRDQSSVLLEERKRRGRGLITKPVIYISAIVTASRNCLMVKGLRMNPFSPSLLRRSKSTSLPLPDVSRVRALDPLILICRNSSSPFIFGMFKSDTIRMIFSSRLEYILNASSPSAAV